MFLGVSQGFTEEKTFKNHMIHCIKSYSNKRSLHISSEINNSMSFSFIIT